MSGQPDNLRFDPFTVKEGLSNSSTYASLKDDHGFMWFATSNGLNRFDGVDFKVFKHKADDPFSLSQNHVKCLLQDSQGYLWVGTQIGGLNRYDYQTGRFQRFRHDPNDPNSISNDEILCIYEDHHGQLWIGTEQGLNLFDYDQETFKHWQHDPTDEKTLGGPAVLTLMEDRAHNMWVGTWDGGISRMRWDGDTEAFWFERYLPLAKDPGARHVWSIFQDDDDRIWLGTFTGLFWMDWSNDEDSPPTFYRFFHDPLKEHSIANNLIFDILQDRSGIIWLGTSHGLSLFDPKQLQPAGTPSNLSLPFQNYYHSYSDEWSLPADEIRDWYEDEDGMIWGSTFGGVCQYNPKLKKFNGHVISITEDRSVFVKSIVVDEYGKQWLGLGGEGLLQYDPETKNYRQFSIQEVEKGGLINGLVNDILIDKDTIWLATDEGLSLMDRHTEKIWNMPMATGVHARSKINTIFKDSQDRFWLGTEWGLVFINQKDFSSQLFKNTTDDYRSLSNDNVICIREDKQGDLWVATMGGLNRLVMNDGQPSHFERFIHDPSDSTTICSNRIICVTMLDDDIWLGTEDGISRYDTDEKRFYNYTNKFPIPDLKIKSLAADNRGWLWGSTREGLFSLDPSTHSFNTYSTGEGLHEMAFANNAHCIDAEGRFYFGGLRGYTSFFPDSISMNREVPPIVLTGFRKFNEPIRFEKDLTEMKEIHLSYKENYITFEFAALNYNRSDKNEYAYMLEGFDKDWMYCGNRKTATYTNLDGCEYTFRVKGSNNDHVWNEAGTQIRLIIHPPFWDTLWFKIVAVLSAGLLIGGLIWLRMRRMIDKTERLEAYNSSLNTEIQERKKVEQVLSEREQLLQSIIDNIPQSIYWKDQKSTYAGCNQNFADEVSLEQPEAISGKKDHDLFWQKDLAHRYNKVDGKVMADATAKLNIVYEQKLANGRTSWVKANKIPLYNKQQEVIGLLGTFENITEYKEATEALKRYSEKLEEMVAKRTEMIGEQKEQIELLLIELRQKNEDLEATVRERTLKLQASNEELKRSNHDLEQFAYIASHDLQEPLRMIGNFVQLLGRKYGEEVGKEGQSYIQFAVEGVTRMSNLIQSLLNYSRIGREDSQVQSTNLNLVVHQKIMDLCKRIEEQGAIIEIHDLSEEVVCEPNQMGILFYNLIGNALKFNRSARPKVTIRQEDKGAHWMFAVSDNGIGIRAEYKDKIFQIFKRLNGREEFEGNGMGLSMCKRIVDEHRGRIWFESQSGQGTTFYFTINKVLEAELV